MTCVKGNILSITFMPLLLWGAGAYFCEGLSLSKWLVLHEVYRFYGGFGLGSLDIGCESYE